MDAGRGNLYFDLLFYTAPTIAVGYIKNGRTIPSLIISRPTVQHDRCDKDGLEEPYHPYKPNSKLVHVSLISLHAENSTIDGKIMLHGRSDKNGPRKLKSEKSDEIFGLFENRKSRSYKAEI